MRTRLVMLALLPGTVLAHGGHGAPLAHWHAGDLLWLGLAVGAAAVVLWARGGRR